jgi:hypothetical protein
MEEKEIWKDIPDYEGYYQVSSFGRVRSIDRVITKSNGVKQKTKGKVLIPLKSKYLMVNLTRFSKGNIFRIHTLMAMAFFNHTPSRKIVVDHIDNNKTNNNLSNLQLITARENSTKDQKGCVSEYVGVTFQNKRWVAKIIYNGKSLYLGGFLNEYDAHIAYQNKLKEIQDNIKEY